MVNAKFLVQMFTNKDIETPERMKRESRYKFILCKDFGNFRSIKSHLTITL